MKETSQILSVNGLRMHVMTAGEGPDVLLMHGFPDTHLVWRKQVVSVGSHLRMWRY